ncbi:MAG TPA: HD domain-containing protein [Steroidobacteraceae bacterium]|nr:HD domain-containing protein [Steroidobacteraceae bacterium]
MSTKLPITAFLVLILSVIRPAFAANAPAAAGPVAGAAPAATAAGIPLDAPWKVRIYELAHSKFLHPGWGWQHSERDYIVAVRLADSDGLRIDKDVLFAAAFLHDMSEFMPCKGPEIEHGECAARQARAMLRGTGFPMEKLAAVQAAERGHMYYSDAGSDPTAVVLHDADSLDFLGDIGAARVIALTGEKAPSFAPAVKTLRGMLKDIPPRLITKAARRIGAERATELQSFLEKLQAESLGGRAM